MLLVDQVVFTLLLLQAYFYMVLLQNKKTRTHNVTAQVWTCTVRFQQHTVIE